MGDSWYKLKTVHGSPFWFYFLFIQYWLILQINMTGCSCYKSHQYKTSFWDRLFWFYLVLLYFKSNLMLRYFLVISLCQAPEPFPLLQIQEPFAILVIKSSLQVSAVCIGVWVGAKQFDRVCAILVICTCCGYVVLFPHLLICYSFLEVNVKNQNSGLLLR